MKGAQIRVRHAGAAQYSLTSLKGAQTGLRLRRCAAPDGRSSSWRGAATSCPVSAHARPRTLFANDEVKAGRFFENQDPVLEPRSSRSQLEVAFGAFVNMDGIDGLAYESEIPGDVVVGQTVRVRVLQTDEERRRVSLRVV